MSFKRSCRSLNLFNKSPKSIPKKSGSTLQKIYMTQVAWTPYRTCRLFKYRMYFCLSLVDVWSIYIVKISGLQNWLKHTRSLDFNIPFSCLNLEVKIDSWLHLSQYLDTKCLILIFLIQTSGLALLKSVSFVNSPFGSCTNIRGLKFSHIDCFLWLSIDHVLKCRSVSKLRYSPSPSCHDIFTVAIPCGKGCWVATTSGNQPYPSSCEQHMMSQTVSLHGYNYTVNLFIFV